MTFAVLCTLHAILGDALTDMEAIYAAADLPPTHKKANSFSRVYASPPLSPLSYSTSAPPNSDSTPDFPSLDAPYNPASAAEQLTVHPTVVAAINRIIVAAGQMATTVQVPFLTLCDAGMGYHLPSCLHVLEAVHDTLLGTGCSARTPEDAEKDPSNPSNGTGRLQDPNGRVPTRLFPSVDPSTTGTGWSPTANRIGSLIDSGKPLRELVANPETKYASVGDADASAVAAFVGL
ncbi:hypothetical protein DFH08DRAFT_960446 [Mycena albidolilacea]|uniref:Uncharacterized protein n=1 Tax=Mycena albidolilacea TaxID=1033008 RepID=A0AAD7A297_9AGAR|nr:hypothetical protein DFH08DRAFT_960446 [Mycena albidolilacea]